MRRTGGTLLRLDVRMACGKECVKPQTTEKYLPLRKLTATGKQFAEAAAKEEPQP